MCICTDQSMFARLDWVNPPSSTASLLASLKGSMEKVCCGMHSGTCCILTSAHRTRYTGIATPRAASGPPPKANRPPLFASKRAKVRYQQTLSLCQGGVPYLYEHLRTVKPGDAWIHGYFSDTIDLCIHIPDTIELWYPHSGYYITVVS